MEIDAEVRNKLVSEARTLKKIYSDVMSGYISSLEKAVSVEELLLLKRWLLLNLVGYLPITSDNCYFCYLYKKKDCNGCQYAEYHGKCESRFSDWMKISKSYLRLLNAVDKYYDGETYE